MLSVLSGRSCHRRNPARPQLRGTGWLQRLALPDQRGPAGCDGNRYGRSSGLHSSSSFIGTEVSLLLPGERPDHRQQPVAACSLLTLARAPPGPSQDHVHKAGPKPLTPRKGDGR
jgi:hypothetical protein